MTLTSTTTAICTVSGFDIALLTAGTCSITATQPGNANVKAATAVVRTVHREPGDPDHHLRGADKPHAAPDAVHGQRDGHVRSDRHADVHDDRRLHRRGFQVSLLAAGNCSLTASQAGTTVYKAASPVSRTFSVTKAPQTITIPNPGPRSLTAPTVVLAPSSTSGLTVTLTSQSTTICTVSGNTVTLKKTGTCKIHGVQAGNAVFAAATPVDIQFIVNP